MEMMMIEKPCVPQSLSEWKSTVLLPSQDAAREIILVLFNPSSSFDVVSLSGRKGVSKRVMFRAVLIFVFIFDHFQATFIGLNFSGSKIVEVYDFCRLSFFQIPSQQGFQDDQMQGKCSMQCMQYVLQLPSQYLFSIRSWDEGLVQPAAFWQIQRIILKKYYCEHTFFQNRLTISIHKQCDSNAV